MKRLLLCLLAHRSWVVELKRPHGWPTGWLECERCGRRKYGAILSSSWVSG